MEKYQLIKISTMPSGVSLKIAGLDDYLTVSQDTLLKHRLKENIVLTPSQVKILQDESDLYLCNKEVVRLLAMRSHSIGDIRRKLKRKNFPKETIDKIVQKFIRQGLLDDSRYALQLGQRLLEQRPCGRAFLIGHLQKKLIDRQTAGQIAEIIFAKQDDLSLAAAALEKRWSSFSQFELETARKKAYNYLSRRGFGYESARRAFEQLVNRSDEEQND